MDIIKQYPILQETYDRIKKHEGFRLVPYTLSYTDANGNTITEDFQTGGIGHKMPVNKVAPQEDLLTKEGWEEVYNSDFKKAVEGAQKLIDVDNVDPRAFGIITEMVFQMGTQGVSKFKKTLDYVNKRQYKEAAKEMLDSKWAVQTKNRATDLSNYMSSISDN